MALISPPNTGITVSVPLPRTVGSKGQGQGQGQDKDQDQDDQGQPQGGQSQQPQGPPNPFFLHRGLPLMIIPGASDQVPAPVGGATQNRRQGDAIPLARQKRPIRDKTKNLGQDPFSIQKREFYNGLVNSSAEKFYGKDHPLTKSLRKISFYDIASKISNRRSLGYDRDYISDNDMAGDVLTQFAEKHLPKILAALSKKKEGINEKKLPGYVRAILKNIAIPMFKKMSPTEWKQEYTTLNRNKNPLFFTHKVIKRLIAAGNDGIQRTELLKNEGLSPYQIDGVLSALKDDGVAQPRKIKIETRPGVFSLHTKWYHKDHAPESDDTLDGPAHRLWDPADRILSLAKAAGGDGLHKSKLKHITRLAPEEVERTISSLRDSGDLVVHSPPRIGTIGRTPAEKIYHKDFAPQKMSRPGVSRQFSPVDVGNHLAVHPSLRGTRLATTLGKVLLSTRHAVQIKPRMSWTSQDAGYVGSNVHKSQQAAHQAARRALAGDYTSTTHPDVFAEIGHHLRRSFDPMGRLPWHQVMAKVQERTGSTSATQHSRHGIATQFADHENKPDPSPKPKRLPPKKVPYFQSHALDVIRDKLPENASPEQARGILLNSGVKPEEMKWSGLDDLIASANGPLSKQKLFDHVKKKLGNVKIKEITRKNMPAATQAKIRRAEAAMEKIHAKRDKVFDNYLFHVRNLNKITKDREILRSSTSREFDNKLAFNYAKNWGRKNGLRFLSNLQTGTGGPGGAHGHNFYPGVRIEYPDPNSRHGQIIIEDHSGREVHRISTKDAIKQKLNDEIHELANSNDIDFEREEKIKNLQRQIKLIDNPPKNINSMIASLDSKYEKADRNVDKYSDQVHKHDLKLEAFRKAIERSRGSSSGPSPKYEQWTMPGGKNYRELLLTLPGKFGKFMHAHWPEYPNVIAHARYNDHFGPNGEKLLHVEELQSDWHQKGRKNGYKGDKIEKIPDGWKLEPFHDTGDSGRYHMRNRSGKLISSFLASSPAHAQQMALERYRGIAKIDQVLDAPFKGKNWHELLLKRLIGEAARKGYDGITVAPAQVHIDRYNLEKHFSRIDWSHDKKSGTYSFEAHPLNPNASTVRSWYGLDEDDLERDLGYELSQKIINHEGKKDENEHVASGDLQGDGLKTQNKGMRTFYDTIVPNYLKEFGKKYGAKFGTTKINGDPRSVHHLPITPEMREALIEKPQKLFQRRGLSFHFSEPVFVPHWTSKTENLIKSGKINSTKPLVIAKQLLSNGVKPDEFRYLGLDHLLKREDPIDRSSLLRHVQEAVENMDIHENLLGDDHDDDILYDRPDLNTPRGKNYRELLMKLGGINRGEIYSQPHWGNGDHKNTLAHARFNDQEGPHGEKLLHVDELQSDWHQDGKDSGYIDTSKPPEGYTIEPYYAYASKYFHYWKKLHPSGLQEVSQEKFPFKADAIIDAHKHEMTEEGKDYLVPDAPFKDSWHELLLKRLLRHAAENGHNGITLTPGSVQIDRYRKQMQNVKNIKWEKNPNGTYNLHAEMHDPFTAPFFKQVLREKQAKSYVGGEVWKRIMNGEGRPIKPGEGQTEPDESWRKWHVLEGEGLSIGGAGMKHYYDKVYPAFLDKFGKKYGVGVDKIKVNGSDTPMHHLPITPKMREDLLSKPQEMFRRLGNPRKFSVRMPSPPTKTSEQDLHQEMLRQFELLQTAAEQSLSRTGSVPPDILVKLEELAKILFISHDPLFGRPYA